MNKAVDTAVTTAVCSLQTLFRKNLSRDSNAAISLVKCNYVCLRFESLSCKAEFAKRKKVVYFCSANFRPEICNPIIFSKQFQNGIFRTGLFWGLVVFAKEFPHDISYYLLSVVTVVSDPVPHQIAN